MRRSVSNWGNGNESSIGNVKEARQAWLDRYIENVEIFLMNTFGSNLRSLHFIESRNVNICLERSTRTVLFMFEQKGFGRIKDLLCSKDSNSLRESLLDCKSDPQPSIRGALMCKKRRVTADEGSAFSFALHSWLYRRRRTCNEWGVWKTYEGKSFVEIDRSHKM